MLYVLGGGVRLAEAWKSPDGWSVEWGDTLASGNSDSAEHRLVVGYSDGRCLVSHGGSFPGSSLVITQGVDFCQCFSSFDLALCVDCQEIVR